MILGQNNEGLNIYIKIGPYGPYIQVGEAKDKKEKPKRVSLPAGFTPENITFDDWRVVKKLIESSMLPIELRGIDNMGFDNLQWHSVTTMHQVLSLFFGLSLSSSYPLFTNCGFHASASFLSHPFRLYVQNRDP